MLSNRCMSCLLFVLSMIAVPSVTSLPAYVKDTYGISPEEVQNWAVSMMLDRNSVRPLPMLMSPGDLEADPYADNTEMDQSLAGLYHTALKRNQRHYSSVRYIEPIRDTKKTKNAWNTPDQSIDCEEDSVDSDVEEEPMICASKRNSLTELIRRLMALQGQRMPEGRASMMRFGSGRR